MLVRFYGYKRLLIYCMHTVRENNIADNTVKISMRIIQEFKCADGRNGIVQHGGFSLLNDGHIAEDEDIYARHRREPSPLQHSPLIFSVLKTSMMHPYTIDVDTIRCGPRGDPTFRWRPQGCPRFLTCPARAAASRDRRMTQ